MLGMGCVLAMRVGVHGHAAGQRGGRPAGGEWCVLGSMCVSYVVAVHRQRHGRGPAVEDLQVRNGALRELLRCEVRHTGR